MGKRLVAEDAGCQSNNPVLVPRWPMHKPCTHQRFNGRDTPCEKDETIEPNDTKTSKLGGRRVEVIFRAGDIDAGDGDLNGFGQETNPFDK